MEEVQKDQRYRAPSETKASYGVTSTEQWQKVQDIRRALQDDIRAIGDQIRSEL